MKTVCLGRDLMGHRKTFKERGRILAIMGGSMETRSTQVRPEGDVCTKHPSVSRERNDVVCSNRGRGELCRWTKSIQ